MERKGVVGAHALEFIERVRISHVVLGMDLEPRDPWPLRQHLPVVRQPQADAGVRRQRPACGHGRHYIALVLPPASLPHTPAGTSTNEVLSMSLVDWPAQE